MGKWTGYDKIDSLAESDDFMIYDASALKNKRVTASTVWKFLLDQLSSQKNTQLSDTIIGAISTAAKTANAAKSTADSASDELKNKAGGNGLTFFYNESKKCLAVSVEE